MILTLFYAEGMPIIDQLQLEEAFLRTESRNLCFINIGSPPAIIMGASSKPENFIELSLATRDQIPIIKRFSGGGTVFIDENTLFVTFIFNKADLPISPFPKPIMEWSKELYQEIFTLPDFQLNENDYVLGKRKCGGNAQYIQKDRWLHHTSFLWDFDPAKMDYLKMPAKTPSYRIGRSHRDFLCALKPHFPDKRYLVEKIVSYLEERFTIEKLTLSSLSTLLQRSYRRTTEKVNISQ